MDQPIIRDPQPIDEADFVVMESTYGDRLHEPPESYTEALAQIIDETFERGGNVIIPSFAVGRTQELLYFMREMKERGLVRSHPDFQVCVDSPLANEATRIYSGDLHGYLDEEAIEALKGGALFQFPGLTLTESSEESKALNEDKSSKVIISASGMCDAGRIRHHLKHNLWRKECAIVFVGYQAEGSLGRALMEGAKSVKLFGRRSPSTPASSTSRASPPTPTGTTSSPGPGTSPPGPGTFSWSTGRPPSPRSSPRPPRRRHLGPRGGVRGGL